MKVFLTTRRQGAPFVGGALSASEGMRYVMLTVGADVFNALQPEHTGGDYWMTDAQQVAAALGLPYSERREGVWSGYGHGREVVTIGDLEITKIARCEGPGHACSYDHGPFVRKLD